MRILKLIVQKLIPKCLGFLLFCILLSSNTLAQTKSKPFQVIGFYTGKEDLAHISFVHEANKCFSALSKIYHFKYDSTNNWSLMTDTFLSGYQAVIFLDTRPEESTERIAFQKYMEHGGSWLGFHFSAFALDSSEYPQNWTWYHYQFLKSGYYAGNTWKPTPAKLKVEDSSYPFMQKLPKTFTSSANEWYKWEKDLRKDSDIQILLSIDSSSFPLGTGPKPYEIWHQGYYPVAWTNKKYKMVYFNMGHNDMDYEHGTNATLSNTFENVYISQFVRETLLWLLKQ